MATAKTSRAKKTKKTKATKKAPAKKKKTKATKKKKTAQKKQTAKPSAGEGFVVVENVNHPGKVHRVDAAKYGAAKEALLSVLPASPPGLTQAEMIAAVRGALPAGDLREKAGWWTKSVHLDLEAKGVVVREGQRPVRWRRAR